MAPIGMAHICTYGMDDETKSCQSRNAAQCVCLPRKRRDVNGYVMCRGGG